MSTNTKTIAIEILRYLPEENEQPFLQTYQVPFTDDMSVLQGLQFIKDELDGTLSFRWSCRMAICGSCGMMINGVPSLSCKSFLRDFHPGILRIEALAHFPIERDLIIGMDDFITKLASIKPYIIPEKPRSLADGEHLQTPAELNLFEQYSSCINCLLCYAACPQYGLNSKFIGPGAMALLHRYNLDSRDAGKEERMPLVHAEEGVFNCTAVGYCSKVCPKNVDPANAVNINKTESAKDYFLRFLLPKHAAKHTPKEAGK